MYLRLSDSGNQHFYLSSQKKNGSFENYCQTGDIILQNTKLETTSNTSINKYTLTDSGRQFYLSFPSCFDGTLPIVLLFHGGGEVPWNDDGTGIMNYTGFWKTSCLCIAFQGQTANNGYSWENSFPWLQNNPKNDVNFVQTVIQQLKISSISKHCNFDRIYASGKSDGGGFCFYLLEYSSIKINKIATCSSAHFTLDSITNTGFLSNQIKQVPILAIHGTGDTVMPYDGQHYLNQNAQTKAQYWKSIDPTLTNTYTFNIPQLWTYIGNLFDKTTLFSTKKLSDKTNLTDWGSVKLITAEEQDHCWMGHENSGPNSNESSNKYFDATTLICNFFDNIPLGTYTNDITTPKTMFV
jgi:poly(3-hydroxybutyrate) depolymerase